MRDYRADLIEHLEATVKQRNELEVRECLLRELLRDEEVSSPHQPRSRAGQAAKPTSGVRLREFVLGSLEDGKAWSLENLKEHAFGVGLMTARASGRSLNITLVNLLREGLVARLRNGRWQLRDQGTQLPLDLAS